MSGPRATIKDRRSWLYKAEGEPSYLVRIFRDGDDATKYLSVTCDCGGPARDVAKQLWGCDHIRAVISADLAKFSKKDNQ